MAEKSSKVDFDLVLDRIGGCGRFQKFYVLLLGLAAIPMGAMTLSNVFISGLPKFMCLVPELQNLTKADQLLISAPVLEKHDGVEYDQCEVYDVNYAQLDLSLNASQHEHLWRNDTGRRQCQEWIYDNDIFTYNIVTRVSSIYQITFTGMKIFMITNTCTSSPN